MTIFKRWVCPICKKVRITETVVLDIMCVSCKVDMILQKKRVKL